MACHPSPFPLAVLAEASRIAPHRRTSSDGICGDERHAAEVSDHNPDSRGIPHAVDVSVDPGVFDPRDYLDAIVARGDPRLKYIVANFSGWRGLPNTLPDVIWDPSVALSWRQNGSFKRDHAISPHVHFSFTVAAEQSTTPLFGASGPPAPPAPPPPPITTDLGAADVKITDITMNLDGAGNGHVPVKGVKAGQVVAVTGIAAPSPEKVGKYLPIPRVNLTIGEDTFAEVVVEGGAPHAAATVRVAHI